MTRQTNPVRWAQPTHPAQEGQTPMTTNKKTLAADQGNESIDNSSVATAYLAHRGRSTRLTYGTWSNTDLPMEDHITIIIPMDDAQLMYADGSRLVRLNEHCVQAQSAVARKKREKKQAEEKQRIRNAISQEIEEEFFKEELAAIDAQATVIYRQIDKLIDERIAAEQQA